MLVYQWLSRYTKFAVITETIHFLFCVIMHNRLGDLEHGNRIEIE